MFRACEAKSTQRSSNGCKTIVNMHLGAISEMVTPASVKERLHGYPKDYTKVKGVTEQSRHRMMANSWHLQVAKFLMVLILQNACSTTAGTMTMELPRQPYQSAIQTVLATTTATTPYPDMPTPLANGIAP